MRDLVDFVTNTLRRSNRIVSHAGLRQHNLFKSCSASEVASLNCIRILFERHENGLEGENLLQSLLERQSTEEILSTCAGWTIDDLYGIENVISNAPLFKYSLALVSTSRHRTSLKGIRDTLSQLRGQGDHVTTVVITCSQQIIVCAYIPVDRMKVFAIFEPQPRTANPNSTRWIICQGIGRTASYLQSILPFDDEPLTDPGYGWQGQLFTNFTSHFIQYKRPNARVQRQQLQELLQESTKTFLELQAKNMGPTEELGLSSQRNSRFSQKTVELNQENRFSTSISHQHHASPYSNDPRKLNGTQNPMLQPVHYTEVDDEDKRSLYYDEFGQVHYLNPVTSAQSPMRQPVHYPNIPLQYDNTSPASSVTTRPRDLEPLTRSMPPQPGPSRLVNIPRQDEVPSPLNGLAAQSRDLDSTTRSMPLQPVPNGYTNNPYSHDDTPKGTSGTLTAAIRSMYPHHDIYNPRQDDATRARDLDLSIHSTPTQPGPSPYADDSFDDEDVSAFNTIQSGSSNTVTRPLSPQPGPSRYMNQLHYGEGSSTSSDRNRPSGSSTVLTPVNAMPQPLHYPIDPFEDEDLPSQVNYIPPNAVSTPIGYQSHIKSATAEKQRSLDSIYDPPLRDDDASDWTNFFRSDGVNTIPSLRDQPLNNTIQQIYPVPQQSYHLHNENSPVLDLVPQVQGSPTPRAISPQSGPSFRPNNPRQDDDLSALDELARTLGWKYCPGCHALIEKEYGRNNIACETPGCTMHFCYECGNEITASTSSAEIDIAVTAHYAWGCSLESPEENFPAWEDDSHNLEANSSVTDYPNPHPHPVNPTFMCPICFDRLHEEDMIELNCEHRLCKDDLKTHIETNLNERSWPTCPVCVANGEDAEVIQDLEELNISQRHIEILEEMRLAEVSVRVECRRPGCPNVFWVDKAIHAQQTVLSCSVCRQRWCRDCSQIIEYGVHSCDGSTEFENLVRDNGWKHCPGCLMPIQKGEGCNHMTCRAPGCTTHFCYTCGEEITSSTVGHEISAAVEEHFSYTCSM